MIGNTNHDEMIAPYTMVNFKNHGDNKVNPIMSRLMEKCWCWDSNPFTLGTFNCGS